LIGVPTGLLSVEIPEMRLGTPTGKVRIKIDKLNWAVISAISVVKSPISSVICGVSKPGSKGMFSTKGDKNLSRLKCGPNHKNKSTRTGKMIRWILFAVVLNPETKAGRIFGFLNLTSKLVFIQFLILPHLTG